MDIAFHSMPRQQAVSIGLLASYPSETLLLVVYAQVTWKAAYLKISDFCYWVQIMSGIIFHERYSGARDR